MTSGLPPTDSALLPADVRQAGPKATKLYETALAFEGVLDQQLAQGLTATLQDSSPDGAGDGDGDGTGAGDASTSIVSQLLPQALTQSVTAGGGLGVARELYDSLRRGASR